MDLALAQQFWAPVCGGLMWAWCARRGLPCAWLQLEALACVLNCMVVACGLLLPGVTLAWLHYMHADQQCTSKSHVWRRLHQATH